MRILKAKKSKYYDAALSNFEDAHRCYERSGLDTSGRHSSLDVRRAHHRKAGFMADFERLAAGHGPSAAPSFLERARSRWAPRADHDVRGKVPTSSTVELGPASRGTRSAPRQDCGDASAVQMGAGTRWPQRDTSKLTEFKSTISLRAETSVSGLRPGADRRPDRHGDETFTDTRDPAPGRTELHPQRPTDYDLAPEQLCMTKRTQPNKLASHSHDRTAG